MKYMTSSAVVAGYNAKIPIKVWQKVDSNEYFKGYKSLTS